MASPQELVERALALSRAEGCVVLATERSETNLRWANNTLTTNGEMRGRQLAVVSVVNGTAGVASGVLTRSAVTLDAVEDLVRASEQAARDAGPADDAAPLVESGAPATGWDDEPSTTSVGVFGGFAEDLGAAFSKAQGADRLLFGFAEHVVESTYLGSSTGLRLRHDQPTGKVELNGKSTDFSRSAWAGASTRDFADVDVAALDGQVDRGLAWAERSIELPPGRYETILPPAALADFLIYLYISATAREADEGRTVFSRAGGGNRIGDELTSVPVTLRSDPAAERLQCAPFVTATSSNSLWSVFDNGAPVGAVDWIRDGRLTGLISPRAWAQRSGGTAAPIVDNLIFEGAPGGRSVEEMVADTRRGLLLTTLWYIREVDPQTLLLTGLTRDGVYLVENGEVTGAVNNFRFNESPVDLLGRLGEVGRTEIALPREWNDFFTRTAMPTVRIPDFNMSTVSKAS